VKHLVLGASLLIGLVFSPICLEFTWARDLELKNLGGYPKGVWFGHDLGFYEEHDDPSGRAQCGPVGGMQLDEAFTPMGRWSLITMIHTDDNPGGCNQRFMLLDPRHRLDNLVIHVDFRPAPGTNAESCRTTTNSVDIPHTARDPNAWTPMFYFNTDSASGGKCVETFTLDGRDDVELLISFVAWGKGPDFSYCGNYTDTLNPSSFPSERPPSKFHHAKRGNPITFSVSTNNTSGSCFLRFNLKFISSP